MDPKSETEKLIASTLDNLPQPFMIFGKKTEPNALEDFWMNKLECIEKQYNEHVVKLERSLLANNANKRQLVHKNVQINRLREILIEKKDKLESLGEKAKKLEQNLCLQKYNVREQTEAYMIS
jgi:predicted RNase H-like nuclease (RuvC/YqgF family)